MKLPDQPISISEFFNLVDKFIKEECEAKDSLHIHKKCGAGIRKGFVNLYFIRPDGSLHPGHDGFGIGPKAVPYCEKCDPPDGFNFTYARRVAIIRENVS